MIAPVSTSMPPQKLSGSDEHQRRALGVAAGERLRVAPHDSTRVTLPAAAERTQSSREPNATCTPMLPGA